MSRSLPFVCNQGLVLIVYNNYSCLKITIANVPNMDHMQKYVFALHFTV